MNITLNHILSLDRCEPWNDIKTEDFMKSRSPSGVKTITEFIEDEGVQNISSDEIFWCLVRSISKKNREKFLYDMTVEYCSYYPEDSDVSKLLLNLKDVLDNKKTKKDIESYKSILKSKEKNLIRVNKDVTSQSKLFNKLTLLISDTDLIEETHRYCNFLISTHPETFSISYFLNYIKNNFE